MVVRRLGGNPLAREGLPLLGLYWLYSSIRWLVARNSPYEAFENAFTVIRLEKQLGIFHETVIQSWFIDHAMGFVFIANTFYTLGYFPVVLLCAILLYRFTPRRFLVFKMAFLLGLGFALVCFSVFPLAPPRMMPGIGFVDTQEAFGDGFYNRKLVLSFYNPYAAMPSLHFGLTLLVGIMAYSFNRRVFRAIGVLYPSFMALAIVTTGHHYFLDIIGGGIVIGMAYGLASVLTYVSPYMSQELAVRLAGINQGVLYAVNLLGPRSPRLPPDYVISPWSREQRDYAHHQKSPAASLALLFSRSPLL
jgi:membrane-associated phospholipid phosphatase